MNLDLRQYHCPIPLLITKRNLLTLNKGEHVTLYLNTFSSITDFELLCQELGATLITHEVNKNDIRVVIER